MESLIRTRVASFSAEGIRYGEFSIEDALRLSEIQEKAETNTLEDSIVPVDVLFSLYEKAVVAKEFEKLLYNGNRMEKGHFINYSENWEENRIRVYDASNHFIGIYEYRNDHNNYKPVKLFL